ncbi:MAG: hypothetical protein Q4B65_01515, partial [Candidatus Saccharibacteria bacterium]|nr:hypothetical protein [Candidatus Saccharibacteria bacterium]
MNPLVFLAKQLVIGVIGSQVSKSRERQRNNNIKHIKGYYLSIFNNSFTMEESIWISSRKIEPMLSRMSNKEIENTVSLIIKNKKRAQKNKL